MKRSSGPKALCMAACAELAQSMSAAEPGGSTLPAPLAEDLEQGLAEDIVAWRRRVCARGWELSSEEWLLGLLALSCLHGQERDALDPEGPQA